MIATAVHIICLFILGLTLNSSPKKDSPKVENKAKVLWGYYKGCEGVILEETETGVWMYMSDCRDQTGRRFFTKNFIKN